jgi:hypothetical protein
MKVFVYYNLHKKCWSVKALEGKDKGRVIAHRDAILLFHTKAKVSQAGRKRVLQEKRKNVHAGIVGSWYRGSLTDTISMSDKMKFKQVTYNPYKYETFVYKDDETCYTGGDVTWMTYGKVFEVK